jgi:hypothetical protein
MILLFPHEYPFVPHILIQNKKCVIYNFNGIWKIYIWVFLVSCAIAFPNVKWSRAGRVLIFSSLGGIK